MAIRVKKKTYNYHECPRIFINFICKNINAQ